MSCVWLPAEILCNTLCHTLAEQRTGTCHTSSWLLYHNPKCWVLPIFLFSRLPSPFDCNPLSLTSILISTSPRFVQSFAASTGYGRVNSVPGNPVLQPSDPATLGCAAEHFSMQDFGFSWWQKVITVPVSAVRIKVVFFASIFLLP